MLDWSQLLIGRFRRMSHVNRHSSIPVMRPENVAEHSWYVALYTLIIARHLRRKGREVDIGKALTGALVHDIDETATGDILRTVKYADPDVHEGINRFANEAVLLMESIVPGIHGDWIQSKDSSLEGQIVALSDVICVASYVLEEVGFGNRHVLHTARQIWGFLKEVASGNYKKVQDPDLIEEAAAPAWIALNSELIRYEPKWPIFHGAHIPDPLYERSVTNSIMPQETNDEPAG